MTAKVRHSPCWRKSSYSTSGENDTMCVEVAATNASTIAARDSKDPDGPALHFTSDEWTTFLARIKRGTVR
ncbi:DUF397 domain-containing protein [Actinomadura sp. GTD37]|uniref:DUF397 domain-containing protein n=1 Tax=Actinomadura sp. GTD37 TaxID=1778030 RepID=UPI0035C07758